MLFTGPAPENPEKDFAGQKLQLAAYLPCDRCYRGNLVLHAAIQMGLGPSVLLFAVSSWFWLINRG